MMIHLMIILLQSHVSTLKKPPKEQVAQQCPYCDHPPVKTASTLRGHVAKAHGLTGKRRIHMYMMRYQWPKTVLSRYCDTFREWQKCHKNRFHVNPNPKKAWETEILFKNTVLTLLKISQLFLSVCPIHAVHADSFACPYPPCKFITAQLRYMVRHVDNIHKGSPTRSGEVGTFYCCDCSFSSKSQVRS